MKLYSHSSILRFGLALMAASLVAMAGTTTALAHRSSSKTTSSATEATSQVDVNNADLKTLETLPGVGPTLAQKIVNGRPYSSLSDLAQVKGMGQKKANALKDQVTFGPASGATTAKSTESHKKSSTSSSTSTATASSSFTTPSMTGRSSSSSSRLAPGQTVDINTASAEELDKLPGIGPTKAQAIVDYRNAHGNFKTVDDIKNVHGIKDSTFSKIKDYIKVGQ